MSKGRAIVGMSGGVDSSVAAMLLQQQGWDVVGVFMKNWSGVISPDGQECSWRQDREDALRVAAHLEIPLLTWDFEEEYRKKVFAYFLKEYQHGRTPNPDVLCNRFIKFDIFTKAARKFGADVVATGHYARCRVTRLGARLYRGKDSAKDQSYFLCRVRARDLAYVRFPLGELTKQEVRAIATKHDLPTKDKPDSQGICFVGEVSLQDFLRLYVRSSPGTIVDADTREVLGTHDGLEFFTIGQRHVALGGSGAPYYVSKKNRRTHTLEVVKGADHPALFSTTFEATRPTWIRAPRSLSFTAQIQVRYRQEPVKARVTLRGRRVGVHTSSPQRAITPGQFVAFYRKDELLGSAVLC